MFPDLSLMPWLALPLAFALDALLGDPAWMPHPVRAIGWWAMHLERIFRRIKFDGVWGGAVFWLLVVLPVMGGAYAILHLLSVLSPWAVFLGETWMLYQGIAMRDLDREVRSVHTRLLQGDLPGARVSVSRIVSRETQKMDESAVCRSALESAAENGVDGVLSPLFWAALLGPVGLWAFKASSTLDSLVGYRTSQYENFGKVSARADDVLNWIPARLALVFYACAALPDLEAARRCWKVGLRDHALHASPNSGYGEALMSGFLGARLGGPAVYHGQMCRKPWFGREYRDVDHNDIPRGLALVWRASVVVVVSGVVVRVLANRIGL